MLDLCGQQYRPVPNTGDPGDTASLIDPTGHVLGLSLTLPVQLNGERTIVHNLCFPCL